MSIFFPCLGQESKTGLRPQPKVVLEFSSPGSASGLPTLLAYALKGSAESLPSCRELGQSCLSVTGNVAVEREVPRAIAAGISRCVMQVRDNDQQQKLTCETAPNQKRAFFPAQQNGRPMAEEKSSEQNSVATT